MFAGILPHHAHFYPRSPCGERRAWSASKLGGISISIHALLAESDRLGLPGWLRVLISIHALLAESDSASTNNSLITLPISIHALLAESDQQGTVHADGA